MADSSRASTAANTITSSTADDTIIMQHKSDVLSAGEKKGDNDTLKIVDNLVLGGVEVDLTSADQITTYNGSANTASQAGFDVNVDLSGVTGGYGASITGDDNANTIVGTSVVDEITGGKGADTITGGGGNDTIILTESTAATDTVKFESTAAANGADTITGFGSGDVIDVSAFATDNAGGTEIADGSTGDVAIADNDIILVARCRW